MLRPSARNFAMTSPLNWPPSCAFEGNARHMRAARTTAKPILSFHTFIPPSATLDDLPALIVEPGGLHAVERLRPGEIFGDVCHVDGRTLHPMPDERFGHFGVVLTLGLTSSRRP